MSITFEVSFICSQSRRRTLSLSASPETNIWKLLNQSPIESTDSGYYLVCNGRRLGPNACVEDGKVYHIVPRVLGGKGGFGSMLRAIGAQIEKTTSREACRDLSGRRMRDINNEKKLKEWLSKEADREREREERRAERLAKHLNPPQHKFEDAKYQEQKSKVQDDLEDALSTGLKRAHKKTQGNQEEETSQPKRAKGASSRKEWLGVDMDSDDSDLVSDEEGEAVARPDVPKNCTSDGNSSPHSSTSENEGASTSTYEESSVSSIVAEVKSELSEDGNPQTNSDESTERLKNNEIILEKGEKQTKKSSLLSSLPPPEHSGNQDVKQEAGDIKSAVTVKSEIPSGPIDLEEYLTEASLCELGMEKLKSELTVRGLKCGGTLPERASRLFSVRGLDPDYFPSSLLAKAKGKGKKSSA